jgi:hypothetical protein
MVQSVTHRTLSGALGCSPRELAALECSQGQSTKNHQTVRCVTEATVNYAQRSTATKSEHWTEQKSEVRTTKSERTGLSGVPPDCPVPQEEKGLQQSTTPNLNGRLMWHAPDSEQ